MTRGLVRKLGLLFPAFGWVANRLLHPKLRCGVLVELPGRKRVESGEGVRVGAFTRIYVGPEARIELGEAVVLGRDVHLQSERGWIAIGEGTGLQDHGRVYGSVRIGRHCVIAPNLYVSSGHHTFATAPHRLIADQDRDHPTDERPVIVDDDCWIGINAVILPGVRIGKGSVIGANSVVGSDLPPYSVAAGAPAKVIKARLAFRPPAAIEARNDADQPYFYEGFAYRRRSEQGYPADREFVVALASPAAAKLEIEIFATEPGSELVHDGEPRSLFPGHNRVSFDVLDPARAYWWFEASRGCSVGAARLLSEESEAAPPGAD